jgi:hypothetical protein
VHDLSKRREPHSTQYSVTFQTLSGCSVIYFCNFRTSLNSPAVPGYLTSCSVWAKTARRPGRNSIPFACGKPET